jgi:dTDP-4-amino-4,6-dideoxygalactose transaminase
VNIPFVNLRLQYESIKKEIDQAVADVFANAQFIGGEKVKKFEDQFGQVYSSQCISNGNGTDALFIILKSLGIGAGDEVITPAFSCIASAEIISLTGAKPVFVDVNQDFYTIDLADVQRKISSRTKAVIAVHLYGQAAPVAQLKEICDAKSIFLIEDCAQAHLTTENQKLVGTVGVAAAFSFYPTKNLGAYGDGGCVITQDERLAEKIRRFFNHGALQKDDHAFEGTNSRLDALQAAVLSVKLNYLQSWNNRRIEIAALYNSILQNMNVVKPAVRENTRHTFHIYSVRSKQRQGLQEFLTSKGIGTMLHYPKAMPFTPAYQYLNHRPQDFPVACQLQDELLSLPVYPELRNEEVTFIADNILHYFLR